MNINIFSLAQGILSNRDAAIDFSLENGLIPRTMNCNQCKRPMQLIKSEVYKGISRAWMCTSTICRKYKSKVSGRKNTWYSESKMPVEKILLLTYCFTRNFSNKAALHETSIFGSASSSETICDWYNYSFEVCCEIVARNSRPIGGPGLTVEIDEGKFGKRKYNRGRFVDGQWVLGGICRETKECFMVSVPRRDRATLIPIILLNVIQGSTIITDCWKSYDCLNEYDFQHLTVNHSLNFIDPVSGANTQTIESTWWQIKRTLPDTHTNHGRIHLYLAHYLFNKIAERQEIDIFLFFIKCISELSW